MSNFLSIVVGVVICLVFAAWLVSVEMLVEVRKAKGYKTGDGRAWFIGVFASPIVLGLYVNALPDISDRAGQVAPDMAAQRHPSCLNPGLASQLDYDALIAAPDASDFKGQVFKYTGVVAYLYQDECTVAAISGKEYVKPIRLLFQNKTDIGRLRLGDTVTVRGYVDKNSNNEVFMNVVQIG